MLADFVDRLVALANAGRRAIVHDGEEYGLGRVAGVEVNGEIEWKPKPPSEVESDLRGVEDFLLALTPASVVFHQEAQLFAYLDREKRTDRVRVELRPSQRFQALEALQKGVSLEPKAAVKLLRGTFGKESNIEPVVKALRQIDFTRTSAGKSHVEHGRESLGRSVEAAVQQADQVPEEFLVACPVYTNPGCGAFLGQVRVSLWLDLDAQRVELRVLPDEITTSLQIAQARLHEVLVNGVPPGVQVFYGSP